MTTRKNEEKIQKAVEREVRHRREVTADPRRSDAAERAFYYIRVIQIPSPRWTAYDQKRYGIKMSPEVPMTVTDRAYTSPIW